MNSSILFFFKSEHDSIFPCSEIIDTFKLFIKLGVDSHLASLFDLLVALEIDLLVALRLPLLDSLRHPLVVALVFLLVTLGPSCSARSFSLHARASLLFFH